jgi:hypothetical protein
MIPMILSSFIIGLAFSWLLAESDFLRCNLMGKVQEPNIETPKRKQRPIIEPCTTTQVKTCKYPAILLLPEFCKTTEIQNKVVREKWKHIEPDNIFSSRVRASYQQMIIGGHSITLKATSAKLYDMIAELQKVADGKERKPAIPKAKQLHFVETVSVGSHRELDDNPIYRHPINRIVSDYTTIFHDCLCGKEWLEAHYKDVIPEPTIELSVNGIETHFNGNYKTGCVHDFMVLNAELWERPRIKGKKIKQGVN